MSSESFLSSSSELTLDDSLELWAMPADGSGAAVPFAIYPPGFNTNDLLIFEASRSDMQPQRMSSRTAESIDYMDSSNSYSGQSSQTHRPRVEAAHNSYAQFCRNFWHCLPNLFGKRSWWISARMLKIIQLALTVSLK